jgi:hypothetical protein
MTSKSFALLLSLLMSVLGTASSLQGASTATAAASTTAADMKGTWSGTFQSKHADISPFTITVVINPNSQGHLIGTSSLASECVKDVRLQVTVNGSNVVLAGTDEDGDSITFRGSIDQTGTLLTMKYIANGSASGRCETDEGTGTMGRR